MREFYGCYLLVSKAPQAKGRTYIGFTVNPRRRIRQHNGLITAGAWKTSRYRPWEMTLVLYGFPTKIQALQFEWAWQNPQRSVTVRPIAEALGARKMAGLRGKILLMLSMLHESPWRYFPLTLQYLQPEFAEMVKETVISAPVHVRVFTAPLDQVPKAINDVGDEESGDDEDGGASGGEASADGEQLQAPNENPCQASFPRSSVLASSHNCSAAGPAVAAATSSGAGQTCHLCRSVIERHSLFCAACRVTFHLECLATRWVNTERAGAEEAGGILDPNRFGGVPEQGHCPACSTLHSWMGMLQSVHTIGWGNKRRVRRGRKVQTVDKAAPSPNAETELHAEDPAPVAKGRKRTAKAPKATATTALDLPSHLEALAGVAEPSLGANTARGRLEGVPTVKGKAAGRKGRTANPGGAGACGELATEQLADGGAAVEESALQQAGAKKPRASRRKAGVVTTAGVGATVSDGAGSFGPTATTVELAQASGAEVGGKLIESPPKRPRQARRVPAHPKDPQLQKDSTKPSASPPRAALPCPIRDTNGQGLLRTCDATQVMEDTSPIPLWRRLQTRAAGATSTAVTTAETRDLPAVPTWHSQAACLGSASYSIISSEDVEDGDEPPGEPSAACFVGQDDPVVATTHRRAITAAGSVFILNATSSDEPDTVDEDSDKGNDDTDSNEGVEVLGDPLQPATAGSSLGICLKSLSGGESPGAYAITPQQLHVPSRCAAASLQSSPLDHQPAPRFPDVLLAIMPPPATSQGSPPPSPMDASPGLHYRAVLPTACEAAASPTRTPLRTLPATQAFGSPAWCLPGSDSSPASAPDRAGGSAGGAVTALMSQLRCSGCTSPPGNQATSSCLAPLGGIACAATASTAAAQSYRAHQQNTDCLGAERLAAAPSLSVAAPAAEHGGAQVGRAARVFPSQCTTQTEGRHKGPLRQTKVAEVVDLCSPLPLSSRLARRQVGVVGALGQVGSGLVGKRLRSPKLPTRLPACGATSDQDDGVSKHGAAEGRTHALWAAHGESRSFAASAGTAIHDTTRGVHHSTAAAGFGPAGQAAAVLRPLPEEQNATGSWSVSPWPIRQRRGQMGNSGMQEGAAVEGEKPGAGHCLQERTRGLELEDPDMGLLLNVDTADGGVAGALGDKALQEGSVLECRCSTGQKASSDDDVIIID